MTPAAASICNTRIKISIMRQPISSITIRRTADRHKFRPVERCAADQPAVDVRHGKQVFAALGAFHTASVKDQHRLRKGPVLAAHLLADVLMHRLRLLGRGRLARADGHPGS